eukprot:TCONS_00069324-protein
MSNMTTEGQAALNSTSITIKAFGIILYTIVSVIHGIGLISLCFIKTSKRLSPQQRLYLINISVIELGFCFSGIIVRASHLAGTNTLNYYIAIMTGCGLGLWYFLVMVLLTVDRFLAVYLDIHYDRKWPYSRNKILLALVFIIIVSVTLFLFTINPHAANLVYILEVYAWPIAHALLIIVVGFTYGYLCQKIRFYRKEAKRHQDSLKKNMIERETEVSEQNNHKLTVNYDNESEKLSHFKRISNSFRRSKLICSNFNRAKKRFYLPNLLIASFLLF